ncbi:hypothetical protein TRFO_37046 [Tritrichomonas foetus]|uniref:Uncharacterized protein n=1 Tax=Tritrichomonas foetus TaxID=1144522 RepID=A0A1J4JC19_9EUKA|nr:hypothetical protein TRFO_37046 [Tritrichomonas foetus]|eukprot:OHS96734.1 hypothetical protein TRFO_37046 [Tritrichomonas foetus]
MSEFEVIEDIINEDQLVATEKILDDRIASASRQLTSLETKEMKLHKEYRTAQKKLIESHKTNLKLTEKTKKLTESPANPAKPGSFFIQLRHVEADIERNEQEIEGLKMVINNLKSEKNKANAKSNRLYAKLEELRSQHESAHLDEVAKKTKLANLTEQLNNTTEECKSLKELVEEIKAKLKEAAGDMKELSPQETARLVAQRDALQREVKERMKWLEDKQNEERVLQNKFQITQTKRSRTFSSHASTSSWISERATLIAKLKKVRKDLRNLETHQRGVTQKQSRNQEILEDLNFNSDDAKLALIAERKSFPTQMPEFMKIALSIEQEQSMKYENDLAELDRIQEEVNKFKSDTTHFMKMDEEMAENGPRMTLLKEELSELRAKY